MSRREVGTQLKTLDKGLSGQAGDRTAPQPHTSCIRQHHPTQGTERMPRPTREQFERAADRVWRVLRRMPRDDRPLLERAEWMGELDDVWVCGQRV